jgi:hypothetical protein
MPAIAIWSPEDEVLGTVAPLGLAAAAGTALVVDLDSGSSRYPGGPTLADLAEEGPAREDLTPTRRGVAVMGNGGIDPAQTVDLVRALIDGWPAVVLRLPGDHSGGDGAVPILPLVPGHPVPHPPGPVVYQRSAWRVTAPEGAVVLPRPRAGTLGALLGGRMPGRSDRWVRAWRRVWEQPWV